MNRENDDAGIDAKSTSAESRRDFIKQAGMMTALAVGAAAAPAAQGAEAASPGAGTAVESAGWTPPENPPDLSEFANPSGLLLGKPGSYDAEKLPPNAFMPHDLTRVAAAFGAMDVPISSMDGQVSAAIEAQISDSYVKMRDVFNYLASEAVGHVSRINSGAVAANTGKGPEAYQAAVAAYRDFISTKGGYNNAITSLVVTPSIVHTTKAGQIGIVVAIGVGVEWSNPISSSSSYLATSSSG